MPYYIIVTTDPRMVRRIFRILQRHGVYVATTAILVEVGGESAGGVLGGVRRLDARRVFVVRGYLPLPVPH